MAAGESISRGMPCSRASLAGMLSRFPSCLTAKIVTPNLKIAPSNISYRFLRRTAKSNKNNK
jgi:hypothetical protein